jgi:hypothetical protein
MERLVMGEYDRQREKTLGWSIVHKDLAHTVGIYYHHTSLWEPPELKKNTSNGQPAAVNPQQTKQNIKATKKKKEKGKRASSDELLIFNADPGIDEPFLELVSSRGRLRKIQRDDEEEETVSQFRKIKYYLVSYMDDDEYIPQGEALLRTEEIWIEAGQDKKKVETEEQEFDLENLRRHGVVFGLNNVELEVYTGKEWVEEWSSLEKGDLPVALRVSYDDERDPLETREKVFTFPLSYLEVEEPEDEF